MSRWFRRRRQKQVRQFVCEVPSRITKLGEHGDIDPSRSRPPIHFTKTVHLSARKEERDRIPTKIDMSSVLVRLGEGIISAWIELDCHFS
jgi:hypothetical protein